MAEVWTVLSILKWTEDYFRKNDLHSPRLDAELLLSYVLGMDRLHLYLQFDRPLSDKERGDYKVMIRRRITYEPVQYITGEAFFFGLKFSVNSAVLIPRPETELLVEKAIDFIKKGNVTKVIDIGTGSGAIAISVAHFLPGQKVLASDISSEALDVARANAVSLGVGDRVEFREGSLLEPWLSVISPEDNVLILANLPYVREKEWEGLDAEVKDHEPKLALVSGVDGVDHYQSFIEKLSELNCSWQVLIELGIEQSTLLCSSIAQMIPQARCDVTPDLANKERVLYVRKER